MIKTILDHIHNLRIKSASNKWDAGWNAALDSIVQIIDEEADMCPKCGNQFSYTVNIDGDVICRECGERR